ncbi:MAG: L,D-transpeptidase family protein [Gammaproteobacteria bacterium]
MRMRGPVVSLFIAVFVCVGAAGSSWAAEPEMAERVVINKSERKLYLYKGERVLRSMDVALGFVPTGDKEFEGDYRTPEGDYMLTKRNPASDYFLSIQISYPNENDERAARMRGKDPGGQIMIHGQPNEPKYSDDYYRVTDWTEGCVALSNSDMVDIWLMTSPDTPISIVP